MKRPLTATNPIISILIILLFSITSIYSAGFNNKDKTVVLIMMNDLTIPLIVDKPKPEQQWQNYCTTGYIRFKWH